MRWEKCWKTGIISVLLCTLLAGCYTANDSTPTATIQKAELTAEQLDAYQQMTLYIQEGFRTYNVENSYQAYFLPVVEENGIYDCDILLEGKDGLWREEISYTYDAESGWYTFEGQWEPVLTQKTDHMHVEKADSEFVLDVKENYIYQTQIAQKQDIAIPIHYYAESGPVETHTFMSSGDNAEYGDTYVLPAQIYTYRDDRLDVNVTVEYPEVRFSNNNELEEKVNANLKNAFDFGTDVAIHEDIYKYYKIERADEKYFSLRIIEYYSYRHAAHPGESCTTVTIDMQTGDVVTLEDIVGEKYTPESLLGSGAFSCTWIWSDTNPEEWIAQKKEAAKGKSLNDYNSDFYLTEDSLGLITGSDRSYTSIEAKLKDLGLKKFEE